jgi:hypothetical protein
MKPCGCNQNQPNVSHRQRGDAPIDRAPRIHSAPREPTSNILLPEWRYLVVVRIRYKFKGVDRSKNYGFM